MIPSPMKYRRKKIVIVLMVVVVMVAMVKVRGKSRNEKYEIKCGREMTARNTEMLLNSHNI